MLRRFPIMFQTLVLMNVLEKAPDNRWHYEKSQTARNDQALPPHAERRSHNDSERCETVQPIDNGGRAPENRRAPKARNRVQEPPRAREQHIQPEEQACLKQTELSHPRQRLRQPQEPACPERGDPRPARHTRPRRRFPRGSERPCPR